MRREGGRWNAKLTILLHYLSAGGASVKGKKGRIEEER